MTRVTRWAAAVAVAALAAVPAGLSAQARADSAAFIVRLGHDTVAVERWVRTADRLDAVSVTRSPRAVVRRFSLRFGADGRVTHATVGDTERTVDGAIPIAAGFQAPYLVALEYAARSGAAETTVPMVAGNATRPFTVRRTAANEFTMPSQFDAPMVARLDAQHRVQYVDAGGGSTIERVAWFDIDALARDFTLRDERGTGLGPLSPRDTARATVGGARIMVDYSRPSARGRTVMGGLVPWGEVWRTGANETTTLITDRALQFDAVRLEPGRYSIYTIPSEAGGWELIFNRQTGMNALARDPAQDVGRVRMEARRTQQHVEQLTISIEPAGVLRVEWGGHGATARFSVIGGEQAATAGRLVIAGGGVSRDNAALYRSVLDARSGSGPICVIATASTNREGAQGSIDGSVATFERHGGAGTAQGVLMAVDYTEPASDPAVAARLRQCSGFYFTGGVQSRTMTVLRPGGTNTPALDAILQRHREGAVVGGSSAGAAIMSDPMISGGSTTTSLARGVRRASFADADDDDTSGGVAIMPGIGFLPNALVDQHFLARGRIGRLIAAVLDTPEFDLGFGVDENTALVVDGDIVHPVGASGVVVVDIAGARRSGRSATGIRVHLLGDGDRFDMRTRRVTAGEKQPLPAGAAVTAPDDVFARWAFLHLLHGFAASPQTEIAVRFDGGTMTLRKGAGFRAGAVAGAGVEGTPAGLSVQGIEISIER